MMMNKDRIFTQEPTDLERNNLMVCYLSGQIPEAAWQEHLAVDPKLRELAAAKSPPLSALPVSGEIEREALAKTLYDENPDYMSTQFSGREKSEWDYGYDSPERRLAYRQADAVLAALRSHPQAPASGEVAREATAQAIMRAAGGDAIVCSIAYKLADAAIAAPPSQPASGGCKFCNGRRVYGSKDVKTGQRVEVECLWCDAAPVASGEGKLREALNINVIAEAIHKGRHIEGGVTYRPLAECSATDRQYCLRLARSVAAALSATASAVNPGPIEACANIAAAVAEHYEDCRRGDHVEHERFRAAGIAAREIETKIREIETSASKNKCHAPLETGQIMVPAKFIKFGSNSEGDYALFWVGADQLAYTIKELVARGIDVRALGWEGKL